MSMRDIPELSLLCLKLIAKTPTRFVSEQSLARAYRAYSPELLTRCTQGLIDYVSEAGRLTDAVFPLCAFATGRASLSLRNSKVSAKYLLAVLQRCPQLTRLDVSGCLPVDDDVVAAVLQLCPALEHLCIRNCRKLSDATLVTLQKQAKSITSLSIGGNINITDVGLQHFINQYPGAPLLQELHISGLPLSPALLAAIAKRCENLRELSVGYAILTPETFHTFIEQVGAGLEKLSIAWAEVAVVNPLAMQSSSALQGPTAAEFLESVRTCCPLLTSLDLTGVKNVNSSLIQQFLDYKCSQVSVGY
jgi:hypothetical protein